MPDAGIRTPSTTSAEPSRAECLNVQGAALYYAGQYDEALHRVQLMQDIYETLPDPYGLAQALNNRGELHSLQGRHDERRDRWTVRWTVTAGPLPRTGPAAMCWARPTY
ncbi:tetratricopeptide repeat protein [Streptomyces shenzhenensis]|uniref:tetratricopeptide repeat protein n=1 Tax=Streptomyces shenzhenensis TaxID=943815 RepID=UPI0036904DBB